MYHRFYEHFIIYPWVCFVGFAIKTLIVHPVNKTHPWDDQAMVFGGNIVLRIRSVGTASPRPKQGDLIT